LEAELVREAKRHGSLWRRCHGVPLRASPAEVEAGELAVAGRLADVGERR
jgi:hypothetical protein